MTIKTKYYENIYLLQSYPVVNNILNKVLFLNTPTLIIVIGNKPLELFLSQVFINNKNIKIKRFGNTNFLLSRFKKIFYPFHLFKLRLTVNKYSCKNLYVTFKDWADFGIIQIKAISANKKFVLNPFEAQQYDIKDIQPTSFFEFIYYSFHRFTIGNHLSLKKVEPKLNRTVPLLGLSNQFLQANKFEIINLQKENINQEIIKLISGNFHIENKGIIFIEKDLINTKLVDSNVYWKFINDFTKEVNNHDLEVYLKFKPRNYDFKLQKKYQKAGMKILPYYVPLQIFYENKMLVMGLGFTSSGMAYKDSFEIISFARAIKIKQQAKNKVDRSIKNTILRAGTKNICFPESIEEIVTLIKDNKH